MTRRVSSPGQSDSKVQIAGGFETKWESMYVVLIRFRIFYPFVLLSEVFSNFSMLGGGEGGLREIVTLLLPVPKVIECRSE